MTMTSTELKSALEAIIYAADEPATLDQLASILGEEKHVVRAALDELVASYASDERGKQRASGAGISITFDAGCGRCERSFRRIARFEGRRGARFCIRIEARIERRCHARFGIARRGPSCRRGNSRRVRRPRGETGRARQFAVIFGQSARRLARVVILSEAGARFAFGPFSVRAARSEESLSSPGGSPGGPERFFVVPQNARDSSE